MVWLNEVLSEQKKTPDGGDGEQLLNQKKYLLWFTR